ncbi:aromatic amino acid lyase [Azospirillum sp. RWY-5-1]|uniref:Aromatic amino acid lyase n=1 Tax=Azospirillum oleiclasticum TaxID=2735135 RepID=A0ABX2T5F2_9PROT|nr:aromatic amino acid lyase [Azospirillum oleiclasticum]NYZ12386.1 aromatic amino acid lyase [Azospirillum oleiclasticum]NYZ19547.1 aromatic amino acid lyase [Azospirillum oleiclasticum]
MTAPLMLDGQSLTLDALVASARRPAPVALAPDAWARIDAGRAVVDAMLADGVPAYGITTGVGSQKDFAVGAAALADFNRRLITAHATRAPGPEAPPELVRAACILQLNLFATGRSGVRRVLAEALLDRLNRGDLPPVRLGSSIGASDIVALSQLAVPVMEALGGLAAKEALSLMNSNALTLAQGALALDAMRSLLAGLDLAAALTLEGFRGNPGAWSEPIERAHPQPGHIAAACRLRALLDGSRLWEAGEPRFLQDPLSLRCTPLVNGALHAALDWACGIWSVELNAAVDNPLIDLEAGRPVSHGAMESTLPALALDTLRLAAAKALDASGERMHKLHWPAFSGLPTGLADENGAAGGVQFLNLGHILAAALATARMAATPATPQYRGQVCDGVEDIAGMAPQAVAETDRMIEAAWTVVTIEAATAAWAIHRRGVPADALGRGLRPAVGVILPLLPIGSEGERVFDLAPLVDAVRAEAQAICSA